MIFYRPEEIEKQSFIIIEKELGEKKLPQEQAPIIKRVIHTTADFSYAETLCFQNNAIQEGIRALRSGASIFTDTTMAMAGINKRTLGKFGGQVYCFVGEKETAEEADRRGVTRSYASVDLAVFQKNISIFVVGNAPTALFRIQECILKQELRPALVVGVPVGFVNVEESKKAILETNVPAIVAKGRKGGSNVAAAIVNALLYLAEEDKSKQWRNR